MRRKAIVNRENPVNTGLPTIVNLYTCISGFLPPTLLYCKHFRKVLQFTVTYEHILRRVTMAEMNTKAMYKLSYGLFVCTAKRGDKINGCIINTAMQIASVSWPLLTVLRWTLGACIFLRHSFLWVYTQGWDC